MISMSETTTGLPKFLVLVEPIAASKSETKALVPRDAAAAQVFQVPMNYVTDRQAELLALGEADDEEDAGASEAYRLLAAGKPLISLAESMSRSSVTDRSNNRMLTMAVAPVEAAELEGRWHPDGTWELMGKGQRKGFPKRDRERFVFADAMPKRNKMRYRSVQIKCPPIPPRYRKEGAGKYLIWEADWRITSSPQPGKILLCRKVTPNLFALEESWDFSAVDALIYGGRLIG